MKKKILFYGNCVLSSLGYWLNSKHSDKFEIFDCRDCGVQPSHTTKNFAVWMDNIETQKKYYECVHEKIKSADYFVFQPIENAAIDELKTDYLIEHVLQGASIGVPNFRFFAYPICEFSLRPYIKYIYNNITKNKEKIIEYMINENDPKFKEILLSQYDNSMNENTRRFELQSKICNFKIDTLEFIDKNWKEHQLFGCHHHPIGVYWLELISQLFKITEEDLDPKSIDGITYPNQNRIVDIKQYSFIQNLLPNLKVPEEIETKLNLHDLQNFEWCSLNILREPLDQYLEQKAL